MPGGLDVPDLFPLECKRSRQVACSPPVTLESLCRANTVCLCKLLMRSRLASDFQRTSFGLDTLEPRALLWTWQQRGPGPSAPSARRRKCCTCALPLPAQTRGPLDPAALIYPHRLIYPSGTWHAIDCVDSQTMSNATTTKQLSRHGLEQRIL